MHLEGKSNTNIPAIPRDLEVVAKLLWFWASASIIYETEGGHIHRGHAKLETFKVKAKVLAQNNGRIQVQKRNEEVPQSLTEYWIANVVTNLQIMAEARTICRKRINKDQFSY